MNITYFKMELNDIQRLRLQRIINVASNATSEDDISALGYAFLRYSGLDIDNGYMISSENQRKADIIVEIAVYRVKILVIECKKDTTRSKEQIHRYMQDGGFPHGILIHAHTSTLFSLDINDDSIAQELQTYNNITDYDEILQAMAEMKVPGLEMF